MHISTGRLPTDYGLSPTIIVIQQLSQHIEAHAYTNQALTMESIHCNVGCYTGLTICMHMECCTVMIVFCVKTVEYLNN